MGNASASWIEYWSRDEFWKDSPLWRVNAELFCLRADRIAGFRGDDAVLDIGCGPGYLEELAAPRVGSIHALDVSPQYLDACRARCRRFENVSAGLLGADYTDVRVPGRSFSLFLCVSVVQYYRDIGEVEAMIASARTMAVPGARMLIADLPLARGPAGFAWDALCSLLQSVRGGYARVLLRTAASVWLGRSGYGSARGSVSQIHFTVGELESLIRRTGLDAEIIRRSVSVYAHRPSLLIRF